MASSPKPYFVAGRAQTSPTHLTVTDKHRAGEAGIICVPAAEAVDRAFDAARAAADSVRFFPAHRRHDALVHIARRLRDRSEELTKVLISEVGKTVTEARAEVGRAIDTFRAASEEATRIHGEYLPLDFSPRGENIEAIVKRVPIGVCSFITPFNFPLNLAAHKVGPAIAAGCPFVLKPDPRTPLSTLILGEILAETDLPPGAWSILPVTDPAARDMFVTDPRARLLSFTGSSAAGWDIKSRVGHKKVLLELGGNAACIVDSPINKHDVERIADRLCTGAFGMAGQSCISVQRILTHSTVTQPIVDALVLRAKALKPGDPREESTILGPMISVEAAQRVESWIEEAVKAGAKVLVGGQRMGSFMDATVITNVPAHVKLATEEVFGPVAIIQPFDSFDEALAMVNSSRYGLQAGLFTANLSHAFRAWNVLEVGGVIINDVPTARVDIMPYGGVKDSGIGREGVRYAIAEFTEPRTLVLRNVGRPRSASRKEGEAKSAGDTAGLYETRAPGDTKGPGDSRAP